MNYHLVTPTPAREGSLAPETPLTNQKITESQARGEFSSLQAKEREERSSEKVLIESDL